MTTKENLEAEASLDDLFYQAFDTNHPASIAYVRLKFELKDLRKALETKDREKEEAVRELIKCLEEAAALITQEYCSHYSNSGSCGAKVHGCYADFIYEKIAKFKK